MAAVFPPVSSRTRVARRSSTTASGSVNHIIDTGLSPFATNYWNGNLIAMRSGSADGATRTITAFDGTKTITVSPALPASPGTSEMYEIFTDISGDLTIGFNNSNNTFDSSAVVANRDGSVLERSEWVINALGGEATQLITAQSMGGAVEENALQQFTIGLADIDGGSLATTAIDISLISSDMYQSRAGASFATAGITQPTFTKSVGVVECAYQFLAAQWQTGDMYKLSVSGITATLGTDTAYVPVMIWSNLITELEDVNTKVDLIQADIGDPSASSTNLYDSIKYLYQTSAGASLASVVQDSILSHILASSGTIANFDDTTDSLEALYDALSGQVDAVNRVAGKPQCSLATVDLNQAAATYDLFTGATQDVIIDTLIFRMPNTDISSNGTLTSISIVTDDATPTTFISTAAGAVANLTAEAQLAADIHGVLIKTGKKIRLTIAGGAVGSISVVPDIAVEYRSVINNGYLA